MVLRLPAPRSLHDGPRLQASSQSSSTARYWSFGTIHCKCWREPVHQRKHDRPITPLRSSVWLGTLVQIKMPLCQNLTFKAKADQISSRRGKDAPSKLLCE